MSNAKGRPMAIAWATALALVVPVSEAYVRAVSGTGPRDPWNTFSAEVTIRRGLRDAAHPSAKDDGPPVKYRWERTQSGGHWKSTMVVVGGTRPDIVTPTGTLQPIPPVITRIEEDGDGTEPRFYDLQGRLLRLPTRKDRQKMGASESVFAPTDALAESTLRGRNEGAEPFRARPRLGGGVDAVPRGEKRAACGAAEALWNGGGARSEGWASICKLWKNKRRRCWQTTSGACRSRSTRFATACCNRM